jgi:hypothetical protein
VDVANSGQKLALLLSTHTSGFPIGIFLVFDYFPLCEQIFAGVGSFFQRSTKGKKLGVVVHGGHYVY